MDGSDRMGKLTTLESRFVLTSYMYRGSWPSDISIKDRADCGDIKNLANAHLFFGHTYVHVTHLYGQVYA